MSRLGDLDTRDLLEKAYERLLPALGYLHSSPAGFAASVIVFATWVYRRSASDKKRAAVELDRDYERLVKLQARIRELEERRRLLQRLLEKVEGERDRQRIERQLKLVEAELDGLYEEYDLLELRIAAVEKLVRLKEEGVIKKIKDVLDEIEEGKADKALYDVLRALEERWRKRELTRNVLERIIEEG
ncbi:MAG: hypothetical protein F7C38_02765 [Desulfurococcales archaeon]|nr:hypothetical protein [Desulfurococcales archaeon]